MALPDWKTTGLDRISSIEQHAAALTDLTASSSSSRTFLYDLRDYGGKCDVIFGASNGSITNASKTFTASGAAFTSSDVGKTIWINGDIRTIATVVSATQITVNANMTYTSTGNLPYGYGTDDSAAITSALAALPLTGGTILIPNNTFTSTQIDIHGTMGRHFQGVGGQVNPSHIRGGQLTNGKDVQPASSLIYTGTTGPFLNATDCVDFTVQDMSILYASVGFTGTNADLVLIGGTNGTTPAINSMFKSVNLAGIQTGGAILNEANSVLNLCGAVWFTATACNFSGAQNAVIGLDPNGGGKGLQQFSNAINFYGCVFTDANAAAVLNPGYTWSFYGCTFEPPGSGVPVGVVMTVDGNNILFSGCGFWDASAGGGVWVKTRGDRITFRDCYFEQTGANAVSIDTNASGANTTNMVVEGCQFDNYTGTLGVKPPAGGSGHVLTLTCYGNSFTKGASDFSAALYASTTTTLIAPKMKFPTADPHIAGEIWANSGVLTVSAG